MCGTINLVGYFQENIVYMALVSHSVSVTQGHRYGIRWGFLLTLTADLK